MRNGADRIGSVGVSFYSVSDGNMVLVERASEQCINLSIIKFSFCRFQKTERLDAIVLCLSTKVRTKAIQVECAPK